MFTPQGRARVGVAAGLAALAAAAFASPASAQPAPGGRQVVDLELVLAIDVSQSVDRYEALLQRQGYISALTDPRIAKAIANGLHGRIAMTYVEWSGAGLYRTIVDWKVIDGAAAAESFATELAYEPITRGIGTSISGAITLGLELLDDNAYDGERRVIDISGDGPNSSGGNVAVARDMAIAAGVIINGVAINNFDGSLFSLPDLDVYYRECVVGGPAAFVVAADGFESFADAILQKLVLEIADAGPPAPTRLRDEARVEFIQAPGSAPAVARQKYAPACDIGERMRGIDNPAFAVPPPR